MSDYLIRYVLMNCITVFGFFILLAFAAANIRNGVYSDAVVCVVLAFICIVSFIMGRTKIPMSIPANIIYFSYGIMCIALVRIGEAQGANFLFIYLFPMLAVIQSGKRVGITVSLILITIVFLLMLIPGLSSISYHPDVWIRMLVVYILVLFVTVVLETTRKTKDRLIQTQNQWLESLRENAEAANRMLETAVLERTHELEDQTRIAIEASRAKSEFLATMSHEIRTPLNAVIGLSEIELRGKLPEASRTNIQQIYQSGTSLLGIINDILDISKIEAGSIKLEKIPFDLHEIFTRCQNAILPKAEEKQVTIY